MFSFVIALNQDFSGGGTYFFSTSQLMKAKTGGAVLFHGMHWHSGLCLFSYVLFGLLFYFLLCFKFIYLWLRLWVDVTSVIR
jgi:hypothetical protein